MSLTRHRWQETAETVTNYELAVNLFNCGRSTRHPLCIVLICAFTISSQDQFKVVRIFWIFDDVGGLGAILHGT